MIDAELLDDATATIAWLRSFEESPLALVAAHARATIERLLSELQVGT